MTNNLHISLSLILGACLIAVGAFVSPGVPLPTLLGLALMLGGYFGLLDHLGAERPLNRLARVVALFGAIGGIGWTLVEPRQEGLALLYVIAMLGAWLITSAALLHRDGSARRFGAFGAVLSGGPVIALVLGHVFIGGFGLLGAGWWLGREPTQALLLWPMELMIAAVSGFAGILFALLHRESGG